MHIQSRWNGVVDDTAISLSKLSSGAPSVSHRALLSQYQDLEGKTAVPRVAKPRCYQCPFSQAKNVRLQNARMHL